MMRKLYLQKIVILFLVLASFTYAQKNQTSYSFTVSMEKPTSHYYHITMNADGLKGSTHEFKMPVWTPGYYLIMDYAKYVINFNAKDAKGNPLNWERSSKNGWSIKTGKNSSVIIDYDVFAYSHSVADSYLDDTQGFISPTGIFLYPAGGKQNPAIVKIIPYKEWSKITTGLDPVENEPNTFYAPDFDILYDSPILVGNQEVITFSVKGVPHEFAGSYLGKVDKNELISNLTRMIESATTLMGEIPYKHYSFIAIGPGGGGLEHLNSQAITLSTDALATPASIKRYQSFMAHEYFHNFNVKRIRPVVLGPFDYDKENLTNMLWVSEGFTVYYEAVILYRAGLITRDEFFEHFRSNIARYENVPGHLFQSATQSSYDTWLQFFSRNPNSSNTTISYYDKGAALGLLLDFKIRYETKNQKSLDDVMRTLYQKYYKGEKRGFTDKEFRDVCEAAAGTSLDEIFEYASTTKEIDYQKYFSLAGLDIDAKAKEVPGVAFGASARDQYGTFSVSSIEWNSPAYNSMLSVQDEIIAVGDTRVNSRNFNEAINSHKPGDKIKLLIARNEKLKEIAITLGSKTEKSFKITPKENPAPLQNTILNSLGKL
jgi:predicted metalloprotease with PDZ domain